MPVALLMISLLAAIAGGVTVWLLAGFWWGFAAYTVTGATTLLVVAALRVTASADHSPRGYSGSQHSAVS